MKYKLIVTDIDGTLVNSAGILPHAVRDSIIEAQKAGVKFALCSGRPDYAMWDLAKELRLEEFGGYVLSFNGGAIFDAATKKELFSKVLNREEIGEIYDLSREHKLQVITYSGDTIYTTDSSEYIEKEVEITKMKLKKLTNFKEEVDFDSVKCIMLEDPELLKIKQVEFSEKLGDKYAFAISLPIFLEVTKHGIDKGFGVDYLCETLGITRDEVIAIGDSYNDEAMLAVAGMPVCVENGKSDMKKICKYIAPTNDEDGVKAVIDKFIFGK